jgi:hypothetical protein
MPCAMYVRYAANRPNGFGACCTIGVGVVLLGALLQIKTFTRLVVHRSDSLAPSPTLEHGRARVMVQYATPRGV